MQVLTSEFTLLSFLVSVGGFHESSGGPELRPDHAWNFSESGESRGDAFSSRETDTGFRYQVTNNGKHGNTAVLEFHPADAFELGLVNVATDIKGIEETERNLGSQLFGVRRSSKARGGGLVRGRCESSGSGNEGGGKNELHCSVDYCVVCLCEEECFLLGAT